MHIIIYCIYKMMYWWGGWVWGMKSKGLWLMDGWMDGWTAGVWRWISIVWWQEDVVTRLFSFLFHSVKWWTVFTTSFQYFQTGVNHVGTPEEYNRVRVRMEDRSWVDSEVCERSLTTYRVKSNHNKSFHICTEYHMIHALVVH